MQKERSSKLLPRRVEAAYGTWIEADEKIDGAPSVVFDAVALLVSEAGAEVLVNESTTSTTRQPNIMKMRRNPIVLPQSTTARAIMRRARNILPMPSSVPSPLPSTASRPTQKANSRSNHPSRWLCQRDLYRSPDLAYFPHGL